MVTANTFSLTWGNYNAYLYNLTISEDSTQASKFVTLPPTATGYTFTGLKPYTDYTVKFTPIALDGKSGQTTESRMQTLMAGMCFQRLSLLSFIQVFEGKNNLS